ncbi:MAG: hypothetical protein ABJA81_09410, partial [Nocardioidaceae bacterium]
MAICAAALAVGMVPATAGTSSPSSSSTPESSIGLRGVYLGAVGNPADMAQKTGELMAWHAYADFANSVPDARMVTVNTSARWSDVAHVQRGTALYDNVVRWANTLKARPGPVMLAYSHEPE